jgi:hypothetical protein
MHDTLGLTPILTKIKMHSMVCELYHNYVKGETGRERGGKGNQQQQHWVFPRIPLAKVMTFQ